MDDEPIYLSVMDLALDLGDLFWSLADPSE